MRDAYNGLKGVVADRARRPRGARDRRRQRRSRRSSSTPENSNFNYFTLVDAGSYLSAARQIRLAGVHAGRSSQRRPRAGRAAADKVLAAADGVALRPVDRGAPVAGRPQRVRRRSTQLEPGSTTVVRASGATAELALRRYATESFPVELGSLAAGEAAALELPPTRPPSAWELAATGGALELCRVLEVRSVR